MTDDNPNDRIEDLEQTVEQLEQTVEQLEQTVESQQQTLRKMLPNRRQALKGLGILGAGGLLGASTNSASAATGTHDVGVPGDRATVYAAEVLDDNDTKLVDVPNGGPVEFPEGVSTAKLGSERHYAGEYDGGDPDTRLSNAIAAATAGDVLHLESAAYFADRTISKALRITGTGTAGDQTVGTRIETAQWTISGRTLLQRVNTNNGDIIIDQSGAAVVGLRNSGGSITVNVNGVLLSQLNNADVTFAPGTTGGLVDSSIGTTVTDNGTNTVGNIG